jgi:hypothetical protein
MKVSSGLPSGQARLRRLLLQVGGGGEAGTALHAELQFNCLHVVDE